ncbi:MAG: metallophosphoesterase, partial [Candidatus Micrarchaeia archaeon]
MKFVAGEPAACVGRTLFTADLHLGIEFELRSRGLRLGLHHLRTAERLTRLLAETKAKRLVIIGDAKHDVYGFETEERKMMAEFVDALPAGEVTVVKGNHDSLLAGVKGLTVEPASGAVIAGCG